MPNYLTQLKQAEQRLSRLIQVLPNIAQTFDYQLQNYFPHLPAGSCTDLLHITYQAPPEPGQRPELISYSLSELINRSFFTGRVPTYKQGSTHLYNHAYTLDEQDRVQGVSILSIETFVADLINNFELCIKNTMTVFWNTAYPSFEHRPPEDWLCFFVKDLLTAEAELRHTDKTLSDTAYKAVSQILTNPAFQARVENGASNPLSVYRVALKNQIPLDDVPLKGLLVITHSSTLSQSNAAYIANGETELSEAHDPLSLATPKVVLYMPGSGLEEFDSLHALNQELKARLNDAYQSDALLNYTLLKDRQRAASLSKFDYHEITTDVFDHFVDELIDTLNQNLTFAWKATRAQNTQNDLETLATRIEQALGASFYVNPTAILQTRYTRLLENQLPTWLTSAPEESKQQWRRAVERLKNERLASQTTENSPLLENGQKSTLLGYARARLKQQIKAEHQLDIDPDQIFISTTKALNTSPGVYPFGTSGYVAGVSVHRTGPTITYKTTRRSLSELALENVGLLDLDFALTARVHDAQGKFYPELTAEYLKALVRRLNIGEAYKVLLYKTLVDPTSKQVKWRRERYTAVTTAQLQLDVLEAKLAGQLTREEASWVETVLKHPVESTRPTVNDKSVKVHLLTLRDKPMPGVLAITTYSPSRLLCYTPNAPDKVWFRTANSMDDLAHELSKKKLRSYVLQHVSSAERPYIKHSLKQGLKSPTLGLQVITADYLQTAYEEEAGFALRNADEQSTSTFEANLQTAKDVALTVVDVISFVLPTKILLPLALSRFFYSLAEGIDALKRDEKNEAMFLFLDSISHLTDGASDFVGSAVFGRAIRQRPKKIAPLLNPKAASTLPKTSMTLRNSDSYGSGIYEFTNAGDGQVRYYLQDDQGNLYLSQYDNLSETWRIIDERQPNAIYSSTATQLSAGRWGITSATPASNLSVQELIEKASVNVNLSERTPDANGVYRLDGLYYIQQNGIVFEVQYGWLARHLYLNMPGSSRSNQNIYKVRRTDGHGDWQVKRRLSDNTKLWEPLSLNQTDRASIPADAPPITYSDYDAPAEHVSALKEMTTAKEADFQNYFYLSNPKCEAARRHMLRVQQKMLTDALEFFQTHPLPTRPALPEIPVNASQELIFKTLYDTYPGVVIAEAHFATSSKKIILDNMAYLAKQDVKVLYMEHLQTDLHQPYLDELFKTGKMHPELAVFLNSQDIGHGVNQLTPYTFTRLVQKAHTHGIHVKAIDCIASYNPKGLRNANSKSIRHELLSYGGALIIRKNTPPSEGHKWIALTGNTHANTFKGVPGFAEIEGAVGLRVEDVLPGTSQGIRIDAGLIDITPFHLYDYSCLKNDWVLDIEISGAKAHPPALTQEQLTVALPIGGMFLLNNDPVLGPLLIHRSHARELIKTPLLFNPDGTFRIERINWPDVHQKPYADLHQLLRDLTKRGMRKV